MNARHVIPAVIAAGLLWTAPAVAESPFSATSAATTRELHPLSLTGTVGWPGGLGADFSYSLTDRIATGCHASSLISYLNDFGCDARYFFVAGERSGLYGDLGGSALLLRKFLFEETGTYWEPMARASVGYEYRAPTGFTFAGELGGGLVYVSSAQHWSPVPSLSLRFGYSW